MVVLACSPLVSVAYPSFVLAFVAWLVLAGFTGRLAVASHRQWATVVVPAGCFMLALPMVILWLLPLFLLFLAFPAYLAVEFFQALFGYVPAGERRTRMLVNGIPIGIMLLWGLSAKWALYGKPGGLRRLLWYYTDATNGGGWYYLISLAAGLAYLAWALHRRKAAPP